MWKNRDAPVCREIMVDSGALTGMKIAGLEYCKQQKDIVAFAEKIQASRVVMLDVPTFPEFLREVGISQKQAEKITKANAVEFSKIRTSCKKFYVVQGPELKDFEKNCRVLKPLVTPDDGICVGGGLLTKSGNVEFLEQVASLITTHFQNEIHFLGVGNINSISVLKNRGISSYDSSRAEYSAINMRLMQIERPLAFEQCFGFSTQLSGELFSRLAMLAEVTMELKLFAKIQNENFQAPEEEDVQDFKTD